MGIRIQSLDLEIPQDDPFKNDLLGRREPVDALTNIIGSIDGPCVLAVDSAWGMGKTTFLNMWAQYLRNEGFPVVKFNAWETDFAGEPFVALSEEITAGLAEFDQGQRTRTLRIAATNVLRTTAPVLSRTALRSIPFLGTSISGEVDRWLDAQTATNASSYKQAKDAIAGFRKALQDSAAQLAGASSGKPIVVVVDELDRCRPTYAIELLEVAKHLFAVDNVVFVLTADRSQLAHSVKTLYGTEFDASGYLKRFFDVDFLLPEPDRQTYAYAILKSIGIVDYAENLDSYLARTDWDSAILMLAVYYGNSGLSLRTMWQEIHRIALVLASLGSDLGPFALAVAVLSMMRSADRGLYDQFVAGALTDEETVERIFITPGFKALQEVGFDVCVESVIIQGIGEITEAQHYRPSTTKSPLGEGYRELMKASLNDSPEIVRGIQHAYSVMNSVDAFRESEFLGYRPLGIVLSIKRLELLSTGLDAVDE